MVPTTEIQSELAQFRTTWLQNSDRASATRRLCKFGACFASRWTRRIRAGRPRRQRWPTLHVAADFLERLRKSIANSTGSHGPFLHAIVQLLNYYAILVDQLNTDFLTWGLLPAEAPTPEAKWLLKMEARTWKRLRDLLSRARSGSFEICACAGQGYDALLAARDNIKRLWLHHPLFVESLVDPGQQAHHLSVMQSCVDAEDMLATLSHFDLTLSKTNCVAGDVASNVAIAQSCLLQRKWARAAELYFLSFALLVAAPWTDCLDKRFWDVSAEDLVYNIARLVGLSWTDMGDALMQPAEAVRLLAWRSSPHTLLPWNRPQCKGPKMLQAGCLGFGKIHVLPEDSDGASSALCSEFGAFESTKWLTTLGQPDLQQMQTGMTGHLFSAGRLFILPVGTPYPNLWHALHWWIPAIALKQEHGWNTSDTHLGIVFDSKLRNGGHRWDVDRPGSSDTARFAKFHDAILQLLSSNPLRFVAQEGDMSCFREALVGFRSFRYDMAITQVGHQDLRVFRASLRAALDVRQQVHNMQHSHGSQRVMRVLIIQREAGQPRHIKNLSPLRRVLQRNSRFVTQTQQLEALALLHQFSLVSHAAQCALGTNCQVLCGSFTTQF